MKPSVWWFILCALFPLLIILFAVLPTRAAEGYTRKCPYCAEIIKADAAYCKYCGRGSCHSRWSWFQTKIVARFLP